MNLLNLTMSEARNAVLDKKISALELTKFFLKRSEELNPKLNAFISFEKKCLESAADVDSQISRGENPGLLAGVPFGIKDLLCTQGLETTAGSKMLKGFIPPYDATVVSKLKSAGAIVIGKLNLDEFAMGSSNESSYYGACKNPWNIDYVPGGSSGGSASAQASRMVMGTIGTDTGGSIRQPANFCGIVGIKPTYGRVSRYGIVAFASSLDQAGPMASCVEDAALTLQVISGKDPRDGTTSSAPVENFYQNLNSNLKGMKIGIMKEYHDSDLIHPDIRATYENALSELKKLGAEIVEVSVPLTKYAVSMYYLISASEASSNLARYDGVKYGYRSEMTDLANTNLDDFYSQTRAEGFGLEVKRRIILGTYCLSSGYFDAYYKKACQVRRLLKNQYDEAFSKCDAIISPVSTTPAFKIGSRVYDPLKMYLNDIFTTSTNLAGLPGMSVPFGLTETEQLPIGIQLTGHHFQEQKILNIAYALQQVSPVKGKTPNVY